MEVCPGHALDRESLDWADLKFRSMVGDPFRDTAHRVADIAELWKINVEKILGIGSLKSEAYGRAAKAGDWTAADKTLMDVLKIRDPVLYNRTLRVESMARMFNHALAGKICTARFVYRWAHTVELPSYLNGTFESRVETGGGRRGYKAVSVEKNIHANERPVLIIVSADEIRSSLSPVTYTALPRADDAKDERIGYRKQLAYAHETECRIPDGTRVPRGTRISVRRDMLNPAQDPKGVEAMLEALRSVAETELI